MKSGHLHCRRLYCTAEGFKAQQTALMHNRQLYCTAEGFTAKSFIAQQKVLLHNIRFYYMTESFAAQQKSQTCGRNWRKVLSAAEIEDKPILQRLSLDLDSTFAHKLTAAKWYFEAHSAKRQTQHPSQIKKCKKKPSTNPYLQSTQTNYHKNNAINP